MSRQTHRSLHGLGFLGLVLLAIPAFAGEADFEPADIHEHGNPYFGEVKDIKGLNPVENARIKVQVNGLGPDVDPEKVEFSCEKDGFRTVEVMHRKMSSAKLSPVEIECLLAKNLSSN